jgi:hypothetical protein
VSELTPEQARRAADYSEGYRDGLPDARGGYSRNRAGCSDQYRAGYRSGYAWGLDHPAPSVVLGAS